MLNRILWVSAERARKHGFGEINRLMHSKAHPDSSAEPLGHPLRYRYGDTLTVPSRRHSLRYRAAGGDLAAQP